ncbi:hypothetical protein AMTRI_Chr02g262050 [Amborella trichopoda]
MQDFRERKPEMRESDANLCKYSIHHRWCTGCVQICISVSRIKNRDQSLDPESRSGLARLLAKSGKLIIKTKIGRIVATFGAIDLDRPSIGPDLCGAIMIRITGFLKTWFVYILPWVHLPSVPHDERWMLLGRA